MSLHHRYLELGDVTLHAVEGGSKEDPLVILLHGFPEYWEGWKAQIPALIQHGYRVLAPDQRGYNLSEKPKSLEAYNLDLLARDVVDMIATSGQTHAFVIGHDWGAAVAWWVAMKYPQAVRKLVILNVPHPVVMRRVISKSLEQQIRSLYIAFFQLPWLPEALLSANGYEPMRRLMQASSLPTTFSEADLDRYVRVWSQPGALSGMLNWYRALVRTRSERLPDLHVHVPTRIIWGVNDVALSQQLAVRSLEMCHNADLHFIESATHWVQHDEPERVNQLILDFLQTV